MLPLANRNNSQVYKPPYRLCCMGMYCFDSVIGTVCTHLVDGYLPDKSTLIQTADQIVTSCPVKYKSRLADSPFSWEDWDEDAIFENVAYNTRGKYCRSRPQESSRGSWSEAWLLNTHKWAEEFDLRDKQKDQSKRRLLVTLYAGCDHGSQCLANLIQVTGMKIIPDEQYKDVQAFRQKAEKLLDEISLPFRAPCIIAEERITSNGYEYRDFGN